MHPLQVLMDEHRVIEQAIGALTAYANEVAAGAAHPRSDLAELVAFIRGYADRHHHGKEEDILFRDLEKKNMAEQDRKVMQELIDEHVYGRKTVKELVEAKEKYIQGQRGALKIILEKLNALVNFYPEHIEKEDKVFFPSTEEYFSREEQDAMLEEFWEFDKEMIHEKYRSLVKQLHDEKSQ